MPNGITVQCVHCKKRKTLTYNEARQLDGPPMCDVDGGPMVAISASLKSGTLRAPRKRA